MKKILIILTISAIALASCKKDDDGPSTTDDNQNTPQTRMDTFTRTGGWVITAVTVEPAIAFGPVTVNDVWAFLQTCNKDNIMYFKADETCLADEGASKCNTDDPQQATAEWKFTNSAQTEFDLYGSQDVFKFSTSDSLHLTITSLSIDAMTTTNVEEIEGKEHTFTIKYKGN